MTIDTQREIGQRIIEMLTDFLKEASSADDPSLKTFSTQECRGEAL
jgi:hypothetical protein